MSYTRGYDKREYDKGTARLFAEYLAGILKEDLPLDTRTDIRTTELNKELLRLEMWSSKGCKTAKLFRDAIMRQLISLDRLGRAEAVAVLQQKLPKEERILHGIEQALKADSGED